MATTKKTVAPKTKKAPLKKTAVKKSKTQKEKGTETKKRSKPKTDIDSGKLRDIIVKALGDGKAEDIVTINLKGKTTMADFLVIASGTSSRHIISLADNINKKIKQEFKFKGAVEGKAGSEWVVIDAMDVIVHIFHPQIREVYDIEEIWR